MVREVDSTSPRSPLSHSRSLAAIPPDAAKPNPVGTPGGVSGIRPISATVFGFLSPGFRGGDRGSAGSLPSPSPFAGTGPAPPFDPGAGSSPAGNRIHGLR